MIPKTSTRAVTLLVGILTACGVPNGPGSIQPESQMAEPLWIDGPTEEVRTLLLPPATVGRVDGPGIPDADLSIGAFYARYDSNLGPVDQLALLVQLEGDDPDELLRLQAALTLDIDGVLFLGAPGVTDNSLARTPTEDGHRIQMAIPVTVDDLRALVRAEEVRGRVGLWASFTYSDHCRGRLERLLQQLPEAAIQARPASVTTRVGVIGELD